MSGKKELLAASLVAVALAVGLATISYGLFAQAPAPPKSELDIYTTQSEIGANVSGGIFEPLDSVPVFAYLTQGGVQVKDSKVTFTIRKPDGTENVTTALTDDSGVAKTVLSFLPSEGHLIGTWQVLANASISNEPLESMLTLQCKSENARIDVFSKRNGAPSTSFLPTDQVFLEAQLSYRNENASIAGAPVIFDVKTPNNTDFLSQNVTTDNNGTANLTFQIPWPSDQCLGTWQATVSSQVYEQSVNATTEFDCQLVPPLIDVYTQKGGIGQNAPGGTFVLNETVFLYAQVRDSLNQSVPGILVAFEAKINNSTSEPWTIPLVSITNASGIASVSTRLPPEASYAGTWIVTATASYQDTVLVDTLTFVAQPLP